MTYWLFNYNNMKVNKMRKYKLIDLILSPRCEEDTPSIFEQRVQNRYTSEKIASRFAQTGRSMIEMLGVLAIIGVLSVGGVAGFQKAMMKYKSAKMAEQIIPFTQV